MELRYLRCNLVVEFPFVDSGYFRLGKLQSRSGTSSNRNGAIENAGRIVVLGQGRIVEILPIVNCWRRAAPIRACIASSLPLTASAGTPYQGRSRIEGY
jgi:hypothetical protein